MNTAILIAQLVLQYGVPAANSIAAIISRYRGAEHVPIEEWRALRERLADLPDYWEFVDAPGGNVPTAAKNPA